MINNYLTDRTLSKFGGDNLDNKIYLRNLLLNRVRNVYSDQKVLILTGENYNRCMKELEDRNLISKKQCQIAIVERDKEVFKKIFKQAEECPFYKKGIVDLHKSDIEKVACYDYHFQDIDLMCTWKHGFDIIKKRLVLQSESISKEKLRGSKFFMFSLSEWGIKLEESYSYLKELLETLNCKLWGLDKCEGRYGKGEAILSSGHRSFIRQHIICCNNQDEWGSVKKIILYRYRDTTNMMTCLIEHS